MDCYPEYHNHYYNSIHNTYFSANSHPSVHRFGSTQSSNETMQSSFYEGFSRHNLYNHLNHNANHYNGPGSFSSSFESNNENSQFYYPNVHQQTTSSYYGSPHSPHFPHQNTYDSYPYRNIPSNYRYHYGYQSQHYPPHLQSHSPHHFYPLQHQQQYNNASSDQHYNHYSTPPTSSSPSQTTQQQQQQDFNSSTNNTRSNEFSTPSQFNTTPSRLEDENSENLLDKSIKHADESTTTTSNAVQMNEPDDNDDDDNINNSRDEQQCVNSLSQESSIENNKDENLNAPKENSEQAEIAINKNDNNNTDEEVAKKHKNESFNENENCKENQQHIQNEEGTSATDYSPEHSSVNKIQHEKQQNVAATINRSSEHQIIPNINDRSSTPIAAFNSHNHISSHNYSHKRYPPMSWYTHEYYNNWMMNPDDRRGFPDSQTFFSSMRNKNKNNDKHKMQQDSSSTSTKRTKRKPKVEEPIQRLNPNKDNMKNVTPLPGFLQTFGQTEIGKFSEAFYTSDSPLHYYNNNIESDIDSPQLDWDSLDGPIGNPMPMQVASSFYMYGSENDSPISSFSEIMCKDF